MDTNPTGNFANFLRTSQAGLTPHQEAGSRVTGADESAHRGGEAYRSPE